MSLADVTFLKNPMSGIKILNSYYVQKKAADQLVCKNISDTKSMIHLSQIKMTEKITCQQAHVSHH